VTAPFARYFGHTAQAQFRIGSIDFGVENLTGEGLTIRWRVLRTISPDSDTASVEVVNLSRAYTEQIAAVWPVTPRSQTEGSIALGWDRSPPRVVLAGKIWRVYPERRADVDTLTVIEFGAGLAEMRDTPAVVDVFDTLGYPWSQVVQLVVREAGFTLSPDAAPVIDGAASRRGLVASLSGSLIQRGASVRSVLESIMETLGLQWTVDSIGVVRVMSNDGLRLDLPPVILTPDSGLLSWEVVDDGGVDLHALAYPGLEPGQAIQVVDDRGRPVGSRTARVEQVEYTGGTDGESTMRVIARRRRGYA